ncbi:hypothetical protein ACQKLX_10050 [Bosea sp. NPDC003192]|uniref:hypothetical protein n=1 Tax=Bosea sp. NPDC003192 TaxID=3390551 RepID=UPI003CFCF4BE
MTATIIDLAARREARDAAEREDLEVASYGIAQERPGDGFELYAELRSGRRVLVGGDLPFAEAHRRLQTAIEAETVQSAPARRGRYTN